MEADKLVESVKFLLRGVRDLSDRFVESNEGISNTFTSVYSDIRDIQDQLDEIKLAVENAIDEQLLSSDSNRVTRELPVRDEDRQHLIPALNLPLEGLLDVYRNTPVLLQPFARPCSISGKTLSGAISEVELEVFAQGTTWVIETQDGEWVLVPRPGMLQRQKQVEGLGRLFDLSADVALPADIELLKAGSATVIEHGRRWYLNEKGEIGLQPDPLQRSLEQRLALIEKKLSL